MRKKILPISILLAVVVLLTGSVARAAAGAAVAGGTGPNDALVPDGEWQPLAPGERLWYGFQYAGDGSQIQIRLDVEPDDGAAFEVWTPDGIRRWGAGLEAEPIGRGATDPPRPGPSSGRATLTSSGPTMWSSNTPAASPGRTTTN